MTRTRSALTSRMRHSCMMDRARRQTPKSRSLTGATSTWSSATSPAWSMRARARRQGSSLRPCAGHRLLRGRLNLARWWSMHPKDGAGWQHHLPDQELLPHMFPGQMIKIIHLIGKDGTLKKFDHLLASEGTARGGAPPGRGEGHGGGKLHGPLAYGSGGSMA